MIAENILYFYEFTRWKRRQRIEKRFERECSEYTCIQYKHSKSFRLHNGSQTILAVAFEWDCSHLFFCWQFTTWWMLFSTLFKLFSGLVWKFAHWILKMWFIHRKKTKNSRFECSIDNQMKACHVSNVSFSALFLFIQYICITFQSIGIGLRLLFEIRITNKCNAFYFNECRCLRW